MKMQILALRQELPATSGEMTEPRKPQWRGSITAQDPCILHHMQRQGRQYQ
eukprot:CAMPEP_0202870440 /NCGR_PEP_ID=MMETSP1391-20130828/15794_1 /ASSEMBLY_ACC=CAM_ASM_000867 /TAXON_ID=1034604 /ORGANISM="Chlamydomonas leiostraca, Strain SAG 11-49" /LENGTH=50 /DNA_ID=CAMNT_0049551019 /DNA_START=148 /DNA_END=300 /DNA_ORIENTATION=-